MTAGWRWNTPSVGCMSRTSTVPKMPNCTAATYAQLPYLGQGNKHTEQGKARLSDALDWLSYIYKARDKHDEEWKGQGQIFPASRPKRSKQIVIPADKRQQDNNELVIKIMTGDDLLDTLIAKAQYAYQRPGASPSALH
jgi:hypothetical protein